MMTTVNIFYDLDGTLIDSSLGIKKAFDLASLNTYGEKADFKQSSVGPTIDRLHDLYFSGSKFKQKQEFIISFRNHYDNKYFKCCTPYEGVTSTLCELNKVSQISQFLFTNKPEKPTRFILDQYNLLDYFKEISCSDSKTKGSKKHRLSQFLSCYPHTHKSSYYFIGDTEEDRVAAEVNKLDFIFASYGYGQIDNPEFAISSFQEIIRFLKI